MSLFRAVDAWGEETVWDDTPASDPIAVMARHDLPDSPGAAELWALIRKNIPARMWGEEA